MIYRRHSLTWKERKAERKEYFDRFIYGWRLRACTACNGSGYYDNNGSPPCGSCGGTGKETYRGPLALGYKGEYY